jgi:hypothetical protein
VWFRHRAWIPIAWLLSLANIVATWFAAQPAEPWHATIHALLAVLFGLGAQRLAARQRALSHGGAELPADIIALRDELAALQHGQSEILKHVDTIAVELERVGEGQRFLTKVIADPARKLDRSSEGQR